MNDTSTSTPEISIRPATLKDAPAILFLVNNHAKQGLMLMKSPYAIYKDILTFVVCEIDGKVIGCARLLVLWKDIAEVASLAVADDFKRLGIGSKLVERCLETAKRIGLPRVFALTYQEAFFKSCGFKVVALETLPHKVFGDCLNCAKADSCDEIAVIYDID